MTQLAGETLSAGPTANRRKVQLLSERVRATSTLVQAWHAIRRNAETSQTASTKALAREFGHNLPSNLRRLQDRLRRGYKFDKAFGATPSKGEGKSGKRPIVVAPLEDRIVQRAILDVMQGAHDLPNIQRVLATPTSIGGIRGRGVENAIALFDDCQKRGDAFVAGSDISNFFTKIPPSSVVEFLMNDTPEQEFVDLVSRALTVELENEDALDPEDRKLFPTGDDGVAQGCPLSALAGNIVLEAFDRRMNEPGRGVTCIRYIDDFIIVGRSETNVRKALSSAQNILATHGMSIYDPVSHPTKAFIGPIGQAHVFLGYELVPGSYPPAPAARLRLLAQIDLLLQDGRRSISKALTGKPISSRDRCFAQTVTAIDYTVRGWRGSFRASNSPQIFDQLDRQIEGRLKDFENGFRAQTKTVDAGKRRRAFGVSLLSGR